MAGGGYRPQAMPGVSFEDLVDGLDQLGVGLSKEVGGEALSGLAERLRADSPQSTDGTVQAREEHIEFGLNAGAQSAGHDGRDGGKCETELPDGGVGADPEALGKARIGEEIADRIQNAIRIQDLHKPFLNQCFRRGNYTLSDEVGNFL